MWGNILLGLIPLFLLGNSNNNPHPFVNRIFYAISENALVNYVAIIVTGLLIIFTYGVMLNLEQPETRETIAKSIFVAFVIITLSGPLAEVGIRFYKSFSPGLNSIYTYRDDSKIYFSEAGDDQIQGIAKVKLKNTSRHQREFFMRIEIPEDYFTGNLTEREFLITDANGEKISYKLSGRESNILEAPFIAPVKNTDYVSGSLFDFLVILFTDEEEIVFEPLFER